MSPYSSPNLTKRRGKVENNYFCIADHHVCIRFVSTEHNSMDLLPSFENFKMSGQPADLFFTLTVDDTIRPVKDRRLVRKFDTGNGDTVVYQLPDGGYQYIIRDVYDRDCCLLVCNSDFTDCRCALNGNWVMRSFGLNDALMLIYAFAGSFHETMLIHASTIRLGDWGYPFIAKSGTGKSTHSSLWLKHIEGCDLMNDDNPVVRIIDGTPFIYGSPWSGKTPCYRNIKARLGAVTRIDRAPFCDHSETKRKQSPENGSSAPRNGQLVSHRDLVSTHYSGHQEYLLPGNHPAVGFSCGLSRTHKKQQSVQRWTPGSSGPPASPQRVSSGLPLISIWLRSETHPLMRPLLSPEREGRR